MHENEISAIILDAAIHVHRNLGPGLLESVYETVLASVLQKRGLKVVRQAPIAIAFEDMAFEEGFKADLIVEGLVIVELKSIMGLLPIHHKQLNTYVRLSGLRLGILINFGEYLVKDGFVRVVNNLTDEQPTHAV